VALPFPEESPRSVIKRTIHMNGYSSVRDLLANPPDSYSDALLGHLTGTALVVDEIAAQSGVFESEFRSCFYSRDEGVTSQRGVRVMGCSFPPLALRTRSHAVCTACITDGWIKSIHDIESIDGCPYHQLLTLTACPSCARPLAWNSGSLTHCSHCAFDLRTHVQQKIDTSGAEVLLNCLRHPGPQSSATITRIWKLLKTLRFSAEMSPEERNEILNTAVAIALKKPGAIEREFERARALSPGFSERMIATPLLTMDDPEIVSLAQIALDAAPVRKVTSCDGCRCEELSFSSIEMQTLCEVSSSTIRTLTDAGALTCGPGKRPRETVYDATSVCSLFNAFKPKDGSADFDSEPLVPRGVAQDTLAAKILRITTGDLEVTGFNQTRGLRGISIVRSRSPGKQITESSQLASVTVAEAAKAMDIYPDAIRRIISVGLLHILPSKGRSNAVLIGLQELEQIKNEFVFVGTLATMAGCGRTIFSSKLESEGIHPVSGPKIDGTLVPLYRRSDVSSLDLVAIGEKTDFKSPTGRKKNDPQLVDTSKWASSAEVSKTLRLANQALTELVTAKLLVLGIPPGRSHENRRFYTRASLVSTAQWLGIATSIQKAAEALSCTESELRLRFVKSGFAKLVSVGSQRLISATDIERMRIHRERFCTCREADRYHKAPAKHFSNLVSTGRMVPIEIEKADGIATVTLLSWVDVGNYFISPNRKKIKSPHIFKAKKEMLCL
jgi:hypothetical protein